MDTYVSDNLTHLYDVRFGAGRRNVLTNSHFDIWQRGTSFTPASSTKTYAADRWCAYRVGTTGCTVSRQTGPTGQQYAMRVQRDSANSSTTAIQVFQGVDTADSLRMAGATTAQLKLTLKAGADFSATTSNVTVKVTTGTGTNESPTASWTGEADALSTSQAITTSAVTYDFDSITIPSSATQVKVQVSFAPTGTASTNDWFEISGAQLSVGSSPTMERLSQAQTLAECQRYYYQWGPWGTEEVVGNASNYSTTLAICVLRFPVTMRAQPTVTFSAVTDFQVAANGGTANSTNVTGAKASTASVRMDITCVGLGAGQGSLVDNNADTTNAAIYVTAEI
tara:strand:- start:39 stop:1052 length:1014 start_codon:yes stop_codon:yes gene_type:complete